MNTKFFLKIQTLVATILSGVVSETKRAAIIAYDEAKARVAEASLAFDEAVNGELDENGESPATRVADGMIDLVGEFAPGDVTQEQKDRLKDIAKRIVDLPDDNAEEKLETLIKTLIDAKDAGYEMVAALNTSDPV